jgi:hypothetical protein
MLRLCLVLFLVLPVAAPRAQVAPSGGESSLYIGSQRPPVRVTVLGTFQQYSGTLDEGAAEVEVSEFSAPVVVSAPLARNVGFTLRTSYGSVGGADVTGVSGVTDTQAALSYYRPVGPGSVVVSASANLPSGTSELEAEETAAAFLIGQSFYGFRLPSLGQGFNAGAGLTYALPAGDALVLGLGAAYRVRGAYTPVAEGPEYDPGDELLVTAGLDYGMQGARFAVDVTYAVYSEDTSGDLAFETGDAFSVTAKWAGTVGGRAASLLGRFRTKGETEFAEDLGIRLGQDQVIPTQSRVLASIQVLNGERLGLGVFAQGRQYAASELFDAKALFDVGATPSVRLVPNATLLTRVAVTFGDLSGVEVGGGLAWEF